MTTITFQHPPALDKDGNKSPDPFKDFQPCNPEHYPTPGKFVGIYIYGLKLEIDGNKKFVPFVVGEGGDLFRRLFIDHYHNLKSSGNGIKEIFNWGAVRTLEEVCTLYGNMKEYNLLKKNNPSRIKELASKMENRKLSKLIWYNDSSFFDLFFGTSGVSKYKSGDGNLYSTVKGGDLNNFKVKHTIEVNKLIKEITNCKKLFDDYFYFIYAFEEINPEMETKDGMKLSIKNNRKQIEHQIKVKLSDLLGIHTTADSKNVKKGVCKELLESQIEIDLSAIQNHLICLSEDKINGPNKVRNPYPANLTI